MLGKGAWLELVFQLTLDVFSEVQVWALKDFYILESETLSCWSINGLLLRSYDFN